MCCSAVVTDARWQPTSWPSSACESRSRSAIPSGVTWPQRSARCQKSTSRRVSTGESWSSAWWIDMRCVRRIARSSSALITCGQSRERARRTARRGSASAHRREHVPAHVVADEAVLARGDSHGCSTSPSPSSSVRGRAGEDHVAREQPVEHRKPSRPRSRLVGGTSQCPRRERPHARHELVARAGDLGGRDAQARAPGRPPGPAPSSEAAAPSVLTGLLLRRSTLAAAGVEKQRWNSTRAFVG